MSAGLTEVVLDETIHDVNATAKWNWIIAAELAVALLWSVIYFIYVLKTSDTTGPLPTIALPLIILVGLDYYRQSGVRSATDQQRHEFMKQFAMANRYDYAAKSYLASENGLIFRAGRESSMTDVVSGRYHNFPIYLYTYSYKTGTEYGGRYFLASGVTLNHNQTVLEIVSNSSLLNIFLTLSKYQFLDPEFLSLTDPDSVLIEGDAKNYFRLRVPKIFQEKGRMIFTPEFITRLRKEWPHLSIEFTSNRLYIYAEEIIGTKNDMRTMFTLAEYLIEKIYPQIGATP